MHRCLELSAPLPSSKFRIAAPLIRVRHPNHAGFERCFNRRVATASPTTHETNTSQALIRKVDTSTPLIRKVPFSLKDDVTPFGKPMNNAGADCQTAKPSKTSKIERTTDYAQHRPVSDRPVSRRPDPINEKTSPSHDASWRAWGLAMQEQESLQSGALAIQEQESLQSEARAIQEQERLQSGDLTRQGHESLQSADLAIEEQERLQSEGVAIQEQERLEIGDLTIQGQESLGLGGAWGLAMQKQESLESGGLAIQEHESLESAAAWGLMIREQESVQSGEPAIQEQESLQPEVIATPSTTRETQEPKKTAPKDEASAGGRELAAQEQEILQSEVIATPSIEPEKQESNKTAPEEEALAGKEELAAQEQKIVQPEVIATPSTIRGNQESEKTASKEQASAGEVKLAAQEQETVQREVIATTSPIRENKESKETAPLQEEASAEGSAVREQGILQPEVSASPRTKRRSLKTTTSHLASERAWGLGQQDLRDLRAQLRAHTPARSPSLKELRHRVRRTQRSVTRSQWSKGADILSDCARNMTEISKVVANGGAAQIAKRIDTRAGIWAQTFMSPGRMDMIWANAAIWLLANRPRQVLDFLLTTHNTSYARPQWVASCLLATIGHYFRRQGLGRAQGMQQIAEAIQTLSIRADGQQLEIEIPLGAMLKYLDPVHCAALFDTIMASNMVVADETLLGLATRFAKLNDFARATDAYVAVYLRNGAIRDARHTVLYTILRKALRHPDGLRCCLQLCDKLKSAGNELPILMGNSLMLSALDADDVHTAMQLYHVFFKDNQNTGSKTLSILIKAYSRDAELAMSLPEIIHHARRSRLLYTNDVIVTDLLNLTVQAGLNTEGSNVWYDAWMLFSEMYNTSALQQLGLPPPVGLERRGTNRQPQAQHLGIMLNAYLHLARKSGTEWTSAVYDLWKQFQVVACDPDGPLVKLATSEHCFHMFLHAFAFSESSLLYATEVIKEMQIPFPDSYTVEKCEPNALSWSILLYGLQRHGKVAQAEQVLELMKRRDIKPALLTWNRLPSSYPSLSDSHNDPETAREAAVMITPPPLRVRRLINLRRTIQELQSRKKKVILDVSGSSGLRVGRFGGMI